MTPAVASSLPALRTEDHRPAPLVTEETAASVARKRRREILLHQRLAASAAASSDAISPPPQTLAAATSVVGPSAVNHATPLQQQAATAVVVEQDTPPLPPVKKRRVTEDEGGAAVVSVPAPTASASITSEVPGKSVVSSSRTEVPPETGKNETAQPNPLLSPPKKKPQMRYDPAVPMTKEETAAWRREQRRKRNRESAAASRQRQRDRITELEAEVEDWKAKFAEAAARLRAMEKARGLPETRLGGVEGSGGVGSVGVSPDLSPQPSPNSCCVPFPSLLDSQAQAVPSRALSPEEAETRGESQQQHQQEQQQQARHLTEKISRPA